MLLFCHEKHGPRKRKCKHARNSSARKYERWEDNCSITVLQSERETEKDRKRKKEREREGQRGVVERKRRTERERKREKEKDRKGW